MAWRKAVADKHLSAANWVALGILYNTGQDCTAGSRLFVQESIYDKFIEVRPPVVPSGTLH